MKLSIVVVGCSVALAGCVSDSATTDLDIGEEQLDNAVEPAAFIGQVCESPIYTQFLGVWEGEFFRDTPAGDRECTWSATVTLTGVNSGLNCLTVGEMTSTVVSMLDNPTAPYECALYNNEFTVPSSVAPANLAELTVPQAFTFEAEPGSLPAENELGIPLFYPVFEQETIFVDENLLVQFTLGTFTRIGDAP